jgi:hypothetical protein
MAISSTAIIPQKGLVFDGIIASANYPTFTTTLTGFGDNFFNGWILYVVKKADNTITFPFHEYYPVGNYISRTGSITCLIGVISSVTIAVGDEIYLIHPTVAASVMNNTIKSGNFTHNNSVVEHFYSPVGGLFTTPFKGRLYLSIHLQNLTQSCILRDYEHDSSGTWRQISAKEYPLRFDTGQVTVDFLWIGKSITYLNDYNISIQSLVLEGASRLIPYEYLIESDL